MFPFSNRKECVLNWNPPPPAFLSHCVISWLYLSGSKQLDRYRWVKFIFGPLTLFCPSPLASRSATVPSLSSAEFISRAHIPLQDVTFVNSEEYRGLVCPPKRVDFISSQACIHEGAHGLLGRDGERQLGPWGPFCFCPLRLSLSRAAIWTCLTINLFGRDVSQSVTHKGLEKSDKSS